MTNSSDTTYETATQLQADHYDRIARDYALHYGDHYSQEYRNRFINRHLFEGLELDGMEVLEAMCGSGETTGYLLEHGASVTGLDVSAAEIEKFRQRWPKAKGVCSSIFKTELPDSSMDCAVVVGGFHHLHPHLSDAVHELHRILKPGGYLCFAEPHKGSVFDSIRRFWYRHDDLFASNEEAIDMQGMKKEFEGLFYQKEERYSGNLAYMFVLNSMVFRIPISLKKLYSPMFLGIEGIVERVQGPFLSFMTVAQWKKL